MADFIIRRAVDLKVLDTVWGRLTWYIAGEAEYTMGECRIHAGKETPDHQHPNCSETIVVREGEVGIYVSEGNPLILQQDDLIIIPPRTGHRMASRNNEPAVLLVCFDTSDRKTLLL